ncbi:flippase-like domain-containing protein [Methanobacterium sp. MZD130B]|uniref:flippase-like domain-containing protein n=1 Tax=Methanobacterium sp. MZD130B TaxID=3394378 RepID=UPI0039FC456C
MVSILLLALLIIWIGPHQMWDVIINANIWLILLAVSIHLFVVWIRSLRWGYIIKQPWEFKKNFIVKTIGLFAGNFTPMRTGGEVLSAVAGKKINQITLSEGLSAGLTERFFDSIIVAVLLITCAFLIPKVKLIAILGGLVSLGLLLLIYLINWREDTSLWIYNRVHYIFRFLPLSEELVENFYHKFTVGLKSIVEYTRLFSSLKNLLIVLLLTTGSWIFECVRLYVVFMAFDVKISFLAIIIIFLLANIIGILSILPGGIGSIELSLTGLFMLFGVPSALGGTIAMVDRLASFWIITALGIIFSAYYARDILYEIKNYTIGLKSSEK